MGDEVVALRVPENGELRLALGTVIVVPEGQRAVLTVKTQLGFMMMPGENVVHPAWREGLSRHLDGGDIVGRIFAFKDSVASCTFATAQPVWLEHASRGELLVSARVEFQYAVSNGGVFGLRMLQGPSSKVTREALESLLGEGTVPGALSAVVGASKEGALTREAAASALQRKLNDELSPHGVSVMNVAVTELTISTP